MGRIEENEECVDNAIRVSLDVVDNYFNMPSELALQYAQNVLLVDISKSLAVIADRCQKTESRENQDGNDS